MRIFFILLFSTLSLYSCTTTSKGFQSSPVVARQVQLDPIKADIVVNEQSKLLGDSKSIYFLFLRLKGDKTYADGINHSASARPRLLANLDLFGHSRIQRVKAAAAYKALSGANYDFMIHPNYTITSKNFLFLIRTYKAQVTGYGAYYRNFRSEKQKILVEGGKEYFITDNN
jgi:hypothetical protein